MSRLLRIIACVLAGALVATVSGDYILAAMFTGALFWWSGGIELGDGGNRIKNKEMGR